MTDQQETQTEQPKLGRPVGTTKLQETPDTLEKIQQLARIQCTQREAAAVLGVHENTFRHFLWSHEKAAEAWLDGREQGKASLRRNQWKMSENNATMAIWLGKQWLDQTDKSEHDLGGSINLAVTEIRRCVVDPKNDSPDSDA